MLFYFIVVIVIVHKKVMWCEHDGAIGAEDSSMLQILLCGYEILSFLIAQAVVPLQFFQVVFMLSVDGVFIEMYLWTVVL